MSKHETGGSRKPPLRRNVGGRCGDGYKVPHLAFRHEGGLGGWSKHPCHIKTREGGVGVGTRSPISRFNTRGLGDSRNISIASKHEGGVGMGTRAPVSLFDVRVGWRVVKTSPSRRNVRGVWGWGTRAPHLAFRREGGVGRWLKHPHRVGCPRLLLHRLFTRKKGKYRKVYLISTKDGSGGLPM